jgi:heterotetrameric sarcosine oxidase gamma subunit
MVDLNVNPNPRSNLNRESALHNNDITRTRSVLNPDVLRFKIIDDLSFHQIAAWPNSMKSIGDTLANLIGVDSAPMPREIVFGERSSLLLVEPLKYWLIGYDCESFASAFTFDANQAVMLDLSHSRTQIRLSGTHASALLNRHLSLDLRESSFPVGTAASTELHHVGVTLWRSDLGFELLLPRAFASSLCDLLIESAAQFQFAYKD